MKPVSELGVVGIDEMVTNNGKNGNIRKRSHSREMRYY